jgi:hypothetical protein
MESNDGFNPEEIANLKAECEKVGMPFIYNPDEPQDQELAHILFVGTWEDKEVIYDAAVFTLAIAYDSELYAEAENLAREEFPDYEGWDTYQETLEAVGTSLESLPEEIQEFIQDTMALLESEDEIKVHEKIELDPDFGYGIGMEAFLNAEELTDEFLAEFVIGFNNKTLELDTTLYSFPSEDED